jgi:uncharacterized membrane protein YtjA (UPF0391 family)
MREGRRHAGYALVFPGMAVIAALLGFSGHAGTVVWMTRLLLVPCPMPAVITIQTSRPNSAMIGSSNHAANR